MYIKISQQDGNLATATNATLNWRPVQLPPQKDVIYRIGSDIGQFSGQIFAAGSPEPRGITWKVKFYDSSTQAWVIENHPGNRSYDDLMGINIIQISGDYTYICTDDQIEYIPDYLTKPSIRYRINESITALNLTSFKHYKQVTGASAANEAQALICPNNADVGGTNMQFYTAGANTNTGKVFLGIRNMATDGVDEFEKTIGSKDIQVAMFLNDAGYIDADLTSRVTQLEYEVTQLNSRVEACEKIIGDLPAITAALQDNVTKFYVSR